MAYTSFFRDSDALDLIVEHVIPAVSTLRAIKVWDAGCSTGEEAYSLAILFLEHLGPFARRNLRILATDKEESEFPQFGSSIAAGRYHRRDVMWVPEPFRTKYFHPLSDPDVFEIDSEVKECVHYVRHDLLSLQGIEDQLCLVVCKNVLMHLPWPSPIHVLEMFHRQLRADGFLALDRFQAMPQEAAHLFERVSTEGPLFRKVEAACG
jgi:chemotaxis protein methyltransferase CheR